MDIVFGLYADGGAWPEHGGGSKGALGAPVVGPSGMLDVLETMLGLSEPPAALVVRIAAWQTALAAAGPQRFWSASLEADGWSTARTLLGWRDELVEAGWSAGEDWPSGRIADLAAADRLARDMPAGTADRLTRLTARIDRGISRSLKRVRLIDARDLLGSGWGTVIDALAAAGVLIEDIPVVPAAPASSALGRMQRWMVADGTPPGASDGTITMATASSAVLAAEVVGHWIRESSSSARTMAIVAQGGDTQLLDHGLSGARQPRAGRSARSPHRGTLQLLLLAFRVSWSPFDPHALMELLLFPNSPIPRRVANRLSAALEAEPGRGGPEWLEAWRTIQADVSDAQMEGSEKADAERLERWRSWVEPSVWDPVDGMPLSQAVAICDRTIAWAVARHASDGDGLYLSTASLAGDVRKALVALDRELVPRTLIDRIVAQALDVGEPDGSVRPEAAAFRSVAHPGAMWAPSDDVLWWGFSATSEGTRRPPWTGAERSLLAERNCVLDDPTREARALGAAWERAVLHCRGRLMFVDAGLAAHDPASRHPLAHRLSMAVEGSADHVRLEEALVTERQALAGETLSRVAIEPGALPTARFGWSTPPGFADRVRDRVESATSLENLLSCHLMWALRHVAGLRQGRSRSIPDENRLFGNLAHALARDVFLPGAPPTPEEASAATEVLLEGAIDRLAAPLRHPSLASDLDFARRRLPSAMAALAECLAANELVVEATEHQISATFEQALAVRGAVDLVARDRRGEIVILDLKWTRSPKSRVEELSGGTAVQLATYGAALSGGGSYRAGYYMLNQRQFLTLVDAGLVGRGIAGARSLPSTWTAVADSWVAWRDAAEAGTLMASGVEGAEALMPSAAAIVREVRCDRCDYRSLCRMRGLR